jgi:hypothetical protein
VVFHKEVTLNGDCHVTGLVDKVLFHKDLLCSTNKVNKFTGPVTVRSLDARGDVHVKRYNGRDVTRTFDEAVLLDTDARITTPIKLRAEDPSLTVWKVAGNIESSHVCGVPVKSLFDNSLKRRTSRADEWQEFTGPVTAKYLVINGKATIAPKLGNDHHNDV